MRITALCNLSLAGLAVVHVLGARPAAAQTLRGRVEDAAARVAIAVVDVTLLGEDGRVLSRVQSDSLGAFVVSWRGLEPVRLKAERIGYLPSTTAPIVLAAGETITATLLLSVTAIEVQPLVISARGRDAASSYTDGIERRRRSGIGHFIMRDQIRAAHSQEISQLLRAVPGITVRTAESSSSVFAYSSSNPAGGMGLAGRRTTTATTPCPMALFVNGRMHRNPVEGVNVMATWEIEAIEIYRTISEVPPEFGGDHARCGVIAIWSARKL
jgi:hypothetical protein